MSSRAVYRTIILLNKDRNLLYGHAILWHLSEIDYTTPSWKKKNFSQIDVFFKDIETNDFENQINDNKIEITHNGSSFEVPLPPDREKLFLEQKNDIEEYNPFINLCTWAEYFYSENYEEHDVEFLQLNNSLFSSIENQFNLPIVKHPHLLGTFTVFTPTRLEEHFRGVDDEKNVGYEIAFTDYFLFYQGANVKVEASSNGVINVYEYKLDGEKHTVQTGSVPDSVITTVNMEGEMIFRSSFGLVKKISVRSSILSTKQIEHNGEIITQTSIDESNFDV